MFHYLKIIFTQPCSEKASEVKKKNVTLHSKINGCFYCLFSSVSQEQTKGPEPFLLRDNPLLLPDEEFNICPHILSGLFGLSLLFCQSSQQRISFSCGKKLDFILRILKINFDYISTKILDFFFFFMCN